MSIKSLNQIASGIPETTRRAEALKLDFALGLIRLMEKKGLNSREFAKALGASPAYVSRVLRGDTNFTIESMVKLLSCVEGELHLRVSEKGSNFCWAGKNHGRRPSQSSNAHRSFAVHGLMTQRQSQACDSRFPERAMG